MSQEQDVTGLAMIRVSSAKPDHGADLLCDGTAATFWESDDDCPHSATLHFPRRTSVTVC